MRVMLVDDSVVSRKLLGDALEGIAGVDELTTAPSGRIALQKCERAAPDVCLVDLEMPEMDGIALLVELKARFPATRVLIVTGNGQAMRERAVHALTAGASDVLLKPVLARGAEEGYEQQLAALRAQLAPRVLQFAPRAGTAAPAGAIVPFARPGGLGQAQRPRALVIGVSTGGPEALGRLLPALPATFALPVLVVQHMPAGFTASLARHLNQASPLPVAEAQDGEPLLPGRVYLAPGGRHLEVRATQAGACARVTDAEPENFCRPSVDVLLRSASEAFGGRLLVTILTGMGNDGLAGTRVCKQAGARVLVQDAATSVVWGMPGAVAEAGLADAVLPLDAIAPWLTALAQGRVPA